MSEKSVESNGALVVAYWPEKIRAAQLDMTYFILGKEYRRIAYGDERLDWGAKWRPCRDCAVTRGQLHVQGCDVEECPVCAGQRLSCDCRPDSVE